MHRRAFLASLPALLSGCATDIPGSPGVGTPSETADGTATDDGAPYDLVPAAPRSATAAEVRERVDATLAYLDAVTPDGTDRYGFRERAFEASAETG